jgi:hypothetical protein
MTEEKERKPKGGVGGTIQIVNLDADTVEKLNELKKLFGVGTNSKAALLAVKNYASQKRETQVLRQKYSEAKETIRKQQQIITQIEAITRNYRLDNTEYD